MFVHDILSDQQAAREIFAVAGNAPLAAHDERAREFQRFKWLWTLHAAAMTEAVFPILAQAGGQTALIGQVRAGQQLIGELVTSLAIRARNPDRHDEWFADFERLKALFERQCDIEAWMVTVIMNDLSPELVGRMTREARAVRRSFQDTPGYDSRGSDAA